MVLAQVGDTATSPALRTFDERTPVTSLTLRGTAFDPTASIRRLHPSATLLEVSTTHAVGILGGLVRALNPTDPHRLTVDQATPCKGYRHFDPRSKLSSRPPEGWSNVPLTWARPAYDARRTQPYAGYPKPRGADRHYEDTHPTQSYKEGRASIDPLGTNLEESVWVTRRSVQAMTSPPKQALFGTPALEALPQHWGPSPMRHATDNDVG